MKAFYAGGYQNVHVLTSKQPEPKYQWCIHVIY